LPAVTFGAQHPQCFERDVHNAQGVRRAARRVRVASLAEPDRLLSRTSGARAKSPPRSNMRWRSAGASPQMPWLKW